MTDALRLGQFVALCALAACGDNTTAPPPPEVSLEARRGHVLVFDEARHQLVLFGGWGPEEGAPAADRGSTWSFDGTTWTRVATTGPSPRHNAVAVYDAARQRVLLYGGIAGAFPSEQVLSDTWEWNGTTWSKVSDAGPSPRVHLNLGYDRVRGRAVLYGGFSTATFTEFRDIWEWSGSAWVQQPVSGPPNTVASGVAFDEKAGTLVLLSATEGAGATVSMDAWTGTALVRLASAAPDCVGHFASLGASRGGFVSAGWCQAQGVFRSDVWNGTAWTPASGSIPTARAGHAMAYDRDRDRVVLYGGEAMPTGALLADTWEFNGTHWSQPGVSNALSVGGAYTTTVSLISSTCTGITVQNNPTSVAHGSGASTLQLSHAGQTYNGTVQTNGSFAAGPNAVTVGASTHTINIAGSFTTSGFTATVSASVTEPGQPPCQYQVRWVGARNSGTNTIPG